VTRKADYVLEQARLSDIRRVNHVCHWPGCDRAVPPAMWGCKTHWYMLPKHLRDAIWASFVPGQEASKTPSPAYVEAARGARDWVAVHYPSETGKLL
jgi:hypothetical protein